MSHTDLVEYLLYAFGAAFLIILIRILYLSITERVYHPESWLYHKKSGNIPKKVLKKEKSYNDKVRLYNLWFQIKRIIDDNIPGDFAELGVYKGDSAWLINNLAPSRRLHLFDTFKGFCDDDIIGETGDAAKYSQSDFADTDIATVKEKLGDSSDIMYHEGYFPETIKGLEDVIYAFVHIDADLYQPVKAGLEYFYPRLSPQGVIIIHDYTHKWKGLVKAVDEFVKDIPEPLIHVPDRHGSVMIIKSKSKVQY